MYAIILLPLCMVAAAASLVVRFRRSDATERLQIKWLATAAGLAAALFLVDLVLSAILVPSSSDDELAWLVVLDNIGLFSVGLIPIAIAFAVLRHRLYEIDVIIRRTLVYAALTLSLAAIYLCTVAITGTLLRAVTGSSGTVAITLSTLAVAGAFHPARSAIQRAVDRRSTGAATTPGGGGRFSERLRDSIDLDALSRRAAGRRLGSVQPAARTVPAQVTGRRRASASAAAARRTAPRRRSGELGVNAAPSRTSRRQQRHDREQSRLGIERRRADHADPVVSSACARASAEALRLGRPFRGVNATAKNLIALRRPPASSLRQTTGSFTIGGQARRIPALTRVAGGCLVVQRCEPLSRRSGWRQATWPPREAVISGWAAGRRDVRVMLWCMRCPRSRSV